MALPEIFRGVGNWIVQMYCKYIDRSIYKQNSPRIIPIVIYVCHVHQAPFDQISAGKEQFRRRRHLF